MKILIPMALAAGTLALVPAPALASHGPGGPDFERGEMQLYACEGGFKITVTRLQVLGESAVQVGFPTGRDDNLAALQLLPATQTGSGVRYASDITSFHEKGDTAIFRTEASAKSEAIPSSTCTLERTGPPAPASEGKSDPVTQTASNGSYWAKVKPGYGADPSAPPTYFEIENVCITTDGKRFFAIHPPVGDEPAFAITEDGPLAINIGEVDASAGGRHYKISNPDNDGEFLTMNFIAPGMREADQPSATAGLSSITGDDRQIDCTDNDQIVYMAMLDDGGVTISLEAGELVLRFIGNPPDAGEEFRGGLFSRSDAGATFDFFVDEDRVSFTASETGQMPNGSAAVFHPMMRQVYSDPVVYFLANPDMLAERLPSLAPGVSPMIDRLSLCNHFAGEASEDAERNQQIMQRWEELACDGISAEYKSALAAAASGSPLKVYLQKNSPAWE